MPILSRLATSLRPAALPLCFAPVVATMFVPLFSPVSAYGSDDARLLDPAEIDRAVAGFTGAAIGEVGGARAPADPRLRLAACAQALETSWHGTRQAAVRVECPMAIESGGPWRIFVATLPPGEAGAHSPGTAARTGPVQPVVKRGDPVTVVVRGRGFSVQQPGEAMENGQIGDWIAIRTTREAKPVRARIERPGLAIIPIG